MGKEVVMKPNDLKCATWILFAHVAHKVVEFKMACDIKMSSLEIDMYHMGYERMSESDDEGIIEYINEVANPYYIEEKF